MDRRSVLVLGIAVVALAGCSATHTTSNVPNGLTPEQQAVTTTLGSVPELLDDGLSDAGGTAGFSARPEIGGRLVPVEPEGSPDPTGPTPAPRVERRFWRVITGVERSNFDGSRASYTIAVVATVLLFSPAGNVVVMTSKPASFSDRCNAGR